MQWLWWPHVDLAMCRLLSGMCSCPALWRWCQCANRLSATHLRGAVGVQEAQLQRLSRSNSPTARLVFIANEVWAIKACAWANARSHFPPVSVFLFSFDIQEPIQVISLSFTSPALILPEYTESVSSLLHDLLQLIILGSPLCILAFMHVTFVAAAR